jgi:hypothetical protein
MQMLDAGGMPLLTDSRRRPDDDNPRGYYEFEPVKRLASDSSWVGSAEGKAVKVIHTLLPRLPSGHRYRVLLAVRNLEEVVSSQRSMLERLGESPGEIPDDRLIEIFRAQLDETRRFLDGRPGFSMLEVRHGALLRRPRAHAESIAAFLGGGLDVDAMVGVVDPTLHRQRHSAIA